MNLDSKAQAVIVALTFILISPAAARKQVAAGTIIVIGLARDRVVIAGDSRTGVSDGSVVTRTNDNYCKITAPGGDTVFAAAGILADPKGNWNASRIISMVFAQRELSGGVGIEEGEQLLHTWTRRLHSALNEMPPAMLQNYARNNHGNLTTAVLAGRSAGGVWIRCAQARYSDVHGLAMFSLDLGSSDYSHTTYFALGKGDIVFEFERDKRSARAVLQQKKWMQLSRQLAPASFDERKAADLVRLTIRYHRPRNDVGGAVDVVELDHTGVHWIAVKQQCRSEQP